MNSIIGWLTIVAVVAVFLALPLYLLYLTFSAKKVDQQIKKEASNANNIVRK